MTKQRETQPKNPNKQTSNAHKFWPIYEKVKQVKQAHALTTWCKILWKTPALKLGTLLDLCVSSLRRGHANLLHRMPGDIISSKPSATWPHGWTLLPLLCYGARWSITRLKDPMHCWVRPGVQYHCESSQLTTRCHIEVPVGVPSGSTQCLGWGCRLASHPWEVSKLSCSWAPKPHVHRSVQRLVLRSFRWDRVVRASTGLQVWRRLARGSDSLSLGTYDVPTSCMPSKYTRYHTSLAICTILSERSEGGQAPGQRIMRPQKSNNLTLRNDKTQWWRGQFELGNTWCTNKLSMTDFAQDEILLNVGMGCCIGLFDAYSLIPLDHMSLWHLYMVTLASVADSRLFDPPVGDDKTYCYNGLVTDVHVELSNAIRQTGKTEADDLLHLRQGSFSVSSCCALWRFERRSQLLCFLMPCIASKFHATSFFLFRILFRILFFFFFDAAWLNEGRCPAVLCQQTQIIKSQCHWENENVFLESNNSESYSETCSETSKTWENIRYLAIHWVQVVGKQNFLWRTYFLESLAQVRQVSLCHHFSK